MGRKYKIRYEKNFFDPQMGMVGTGATRYVDAFNRYEDLLLGVRGPFTPS
jgi:hypothetical protein